MQSKLLRRAEEGEIERVGATSRFQWTRACYRDRTAIRGIGPAGSVSARICFTASMFPDCVAALRSGAEEVSVLAEYFARAGRAQNSWRTKHFSAEALDILKHYAWPGNVRELRMSSSESSCPFERRNHHRRRSGDGFAGGRNGPSGPAAENARWPIASNPSNGKCCSPNCGRHHHHMTNVARALASNAATSTRNASNSE